MSCAVTAGHLVFIYALMSLAAMTFQHLTFVYALLTFHQFPSSGILCSGLSVTTPETTRIMSNGPTLTDPCQCQTLHA